jgi:hypothetical protein
VAASFCEVRNSDLRFACDTEKTKTCGPPRPENSNIMTYSQYHFNPTDRVAPETKYWCCPGCRPATEVEVRGADTCMNETRKACAE